MTKLYSLSYSETRTYLFAALFVAGNIVLPQLCHLIPRGGLILLPIYFFTLIAAYKYGWRAGLLTAIASPLANWALFGMPAAAMLPVILLKSGLLAFAAAAMAHRFRTVALLPIVLAVVTYQLLGSLGEWAITGSLTAALQDLHLGIPGIMLQIFGGWAVLRLIRN